MQELSKNEENLIVTDSLKSLPLEDKKKLVGFFVLLLQVDKRINPELYTKNKSTQND